MNLLGFGHLVLFIHGYRNTGTWFLTFNSCSDIYAQVGVREALLVIVSHIGFEGMEPYQFVHVLCKENCSLRKGHTEITSS